MLRLMWVKHEGGHVGSTCMTYAPGPCHVHVMVSCRQEGVVTSPTLTPSTASLPRGPPGLTRGRFDYKECSMGLERWR